MAGYLGNSSVNAQHYSPQMAKRKLTANEQDDVEAGENRWLPTLFQNYGTPVSEMMASPLKMSLLTGIPVAAIVATLAARGNMTPGAATRPLLTGAAAGLGGGLGMYYHQQSRNNDLKELMTRLPEGATRRDLLADPAYQADLDRKNSLMAAGMQQRNMSPRAFGKFAADFGIPPHIQNEIAQSDAKYLPRAGEHANASLYQENGLLPTAKPIFTGLASLLGHVAPSLPVPGASLVGPAAGAASVGYNSLDDAVTLYNQKSVRRQVDNYNASPGRERQNLPKFRVKQKTLPAKAVDSAAKVVSKNTSGSSASATAPAKTAEAKSTEPSTVSKVLNAVDPRKMDPRLLAALGIGGVGLGAGAYYLSRKKKKKPEDNSEKQSMLNDLMQFGAKVAQVTGMTYDENNSNVKKLQKQYPTTWRKVMAESQGLSDDAQAKPVGAKCAQSTCSPCDMPNGPANKKHMTGASPAVTEAGEHSEEFGTPEVAETEHSDAKAKMPEEGVKSAYAFGYMLGR